MKNFLVILIFILNSIQFILAQDYQVIRSDRTALFVNEQGNVKCIWVDSVKHISDSVFYLHPNFQQTRDHCIDPYGPSWIGSKIITQKNGVTVFLNNEHDSIKIRTNSLLNEQWTAYVFPDSSIVAAKLTFLDTLNLFGQPDSVRTISFQVFDKKNNMVNHKLNKMSIILSKNYGLAKTFNFNLFPDIEPSYFNVNQFQEYNLIGLSNPRLGVQNLSWFDVNDFQVGDEIHVSYESSMWWVPELIIGDSKKTIYKYLKRLDYMDSIVYLVEITQGLVKTAGINTSFDFTHDTIKTVIRSKPLFSKMPEEIIFADNEFSYYTMDFNDFPSKTEPSAYSTFHYSGNDCWTNCCYDGCLIANKYIKGLGGPYFQCNNFDSGGGIESKLVYFNKGNVTWGTPLIITSVEDNSLPNDIEIYPNPAKGFIYISVPNFELTLKFELSSLEGVLVSANEINTITSKVNTENLNSGMYIYRISRNGEMIKSGKLIIE